MSVDYNELYTEFLHLTSSSSPSSFSSSSPPPPCPPHKSPPPPPSANLLPPLHSLVRHQPSRPHPPTQAPRQQHNPPAPAAPVHSHSRLYNNNSSILRSVLSNPTMSMSHLPSQLQSPIRTDTNRSPRQSISSSGSSGSAPAPNTNTNTNTSPANGNGNSNAPTTGPLNKQHQTPTSTSTLPDANLSSCIWQQQQNKSSNLSHNLPLSVSGSSSSSSSSSIVMTGEKRKDSLSAGGGGIVGLGGSPSQIIVNQNQNPSTPPNSPAGPPTKKHAAASLGGDQSSVSGHQGQGQGQGHSHSHSHSGGMETQETHMGHGHNSISAPTPLSNISSSGGQGGNSLQQSQSHYHRAIQHHQHVNQNQNNPNPNPNSSSIGNPSLQQQQQQQQQQQPQEQRGAESEQEGTPCIIQQKPILHAPHNELRRLLTATMPTGQPSYRNASIYQHNNSSSNNNNNAPNPSNSMTFIHHHQQQLLNSHDYTSHAQFLQHQQQQQQQQHQQHHHHLIHGHQSQSNHNHQTPNPNPNDNNHGSTYWSQSHDQHVHSSNNSSIPSPEPSTPPSNNNRHSSDQELQHPEQDMLTEDVKYVPWMGEPPIYPGGLEVVWKETPAECQRIITPQDVPMTARDRGYFTVSELLTLKRCLVARLNSIQCGSGSGFNESSNNFNNPHDSTKDNNSQHLPQHILQHQHQLLQQQQQQQQQQQHPPSASAIQAAAAAAQAAEIERINVGVHGVGGALRKAMDTLDEVHHNNSLLNANLAAGHMAPLGSSSQVIMHTSGTGTGGGLLGLGSSGGGAGGVSSSRSQQQQHIHESMRGIVNSVNSNGHMSLYHSNSQGGGQGQNIRLSGHHQGVQGMQRGMQSIPLPGDVKHIPTPPPPYRTANLVFKLLVIGSYTFRSFSEVNPNRLRVLYNTQKITYECQLPMPPSNQGSSGQPQRKILTIDIAFDQISQLQFGNDQMHLRVEGAPVLNVSYSPSNEEQSVPNLSSADQYLLEQIDNGQLRLSPYHKLYFLNERLVQSLACQFREHPRFRHLLHPASFGST